MPLHMTLVVKTPNPDGEPDNVTANNDNSVPVVAAPGGLFGTVLEALERAGITSLAFVRELHIKPEE